jgi:hypothetical protein
MLAANCESSMHRRESRDQISHESQIEAAETALRQSVLGSDGFRLDNISDTNLITCNPPGWGWPRDAKVRIGSLA